MKPEEPTPELFEKLRNWSEFVREVKLPGDVAAAVACGRSQLLTACVRDMTKDEVRMLMDLIGVYMDTNLELQRHSAQLAAELKNIRGTVGGLFKLVDKSTAYAEFRDYYEEDDE